jgi:hypothetical protein
MRWLLFLPQFTGSASRVRVWRQLQRLGALSLKGAVWVLPDVPEAKAALTWLRHELSDGGLSGVIARADFLEGLPDETLVRDFKHLATARWEALAAEVRRASASQSVALERRFDEASAANFFKAPGRGEVLRLLEPLLSPPPKKQKAAQSYLGRTWVTRRDIHVDRMASAWLINRFVDPRARLKFVDLPRYQPKAGELGFDFHGAAFTHEGPRCTFEVLQAKFCPKDRALVRLGELVHDLDFKDGRFGRPETAGFGVQLAAIASAHRDDEARVKRASALLDDLYAHASKR